MIPYEEVMFQEWYEKTYPQYMEEWGGCDWDYRHHRDAKAAWLAGYNTGYAEGYREG